MGVYLVVGGFMGGEELVGWRGDFEEVFEGLYCTVFGFDEMSLG